MSTPIFGRRSSRKTPSGFFEEFDLGEGGYSLAPARRSKLAIKQKVRKQRRQCESGKLSRTDSYLTMINEGLQIISSSGNVFADLGVPNPEVMKLRAELIVEIRRTMEEKGWNQTEAAKHLGVTPSWLNDVLHGDLKKVTIDRLVTMLAAIGRHVHIIVGANS